MLCIAKPFEPSSSVQTYATFQELLRRPHLPGQFSLRKVRSQDQAAFLKNNPDLKLISTEK
jgi:hypothetical protein